MPILPAIALLAALAQSAAAPTATLKFAKDKVPGDSVVKAILTVTFAEGLHGYQNPPSDQYQIPLVVKVSEKGFTLVKAEYPKGVDFTMPGEAKPAKVYEGAITIPLEIKTNKKPGTYNVNLRVEYQQCNANSCFPPGAFTVKAKLAVTKPGKKV
ncbi:protein-disulfide reductase DsbD domain-containing protein [Fimbriimonas ginsengisoli]|uniref:Thiol:disulfide interchange protein DsbD N-terminal domain-containing protein n=1 Tax=Fimbriimonas ginsengisoli Gsoil 348 TaxID=661478 RepID=A0A068NVM8_FIMGI|nr:protein-disulfide reductase DsbD domain-containing protein [Fimbriimonas ginsengisoli]AIE87501.1 hypothetical protein OP10G_4133 [Fimbriimonas ginsengisoli Gsoil 348]